jgi:DNA replication regulator SLD3
VTIQYLLMLARLLTHLDSFAARLPGPCDSLNRKLGGPVAQSPPKQKTVKPASAVKPKPGAPMKRPTALKRDKDRTLERALSVERSRRSVSRGPAAAIALLRSASQTVIPGLKREASDSSLMGVLPRAEKSSLKERPSNLFSRSVSLSGVDMKAQKKARVDAELKDAISALKKPNRTLAVKDFVEAADKRASAGQLKSKFFFFHDFQAHANMHHRNEEAQPRLARRASEGDARQQPV